MSKKEEKNEGKTPPMLYAEPESITYDLLDISNFKIQHIENLKITQAINEHAKLEFTARLDEEEKNLPVFTTLTYSKVEVSFRADDTKDALSKCLFNGIVTYVAVTTQSGINYIHVTALSNTYLLDIYKVDVSYQNTESSYKNLVKKVLKRTEKAEAKFVEASNKSVGEFVLQYKETDWEFIKRIASKFYEGLYPDCRNKDPKFYFGLNTKDEVEEINVLEYSTVKRIQEYQVNSSNYIKGVKESDYIEYQIKSKKMRFIGDKIKFQKHIFYIKYAVYTMEHGILVAYYCISPKNGLRQNRIYNESIKGISLNGKVAQVVRDKVKIGLDIEKNKGSGYLFPYSTIAASPDGSGWYCMPEVGDYVRVYFPDEKERHCYAISSISGYTTESTGGEADKMADPNVKYLSTKSGMTIDMWIVVMISNILRDILKS
ncbi:hypothetical protein [Anaerosporobacter sp.]|uniref:hypothetical protein n=1 Tax=Anaerosporobacter sp. TaxID=1872529 RepID=UPI00286F43F6|nr:hypothetical protein [Anaerosporobacter sp.]